MFRKYNMCPDGLFPGCVFILYTPFRNYLQAGLIPITLQVVSDCGIQMCTHN
jgi:hypothetical protein